MASRSQKPATASKKATTEGDAQQLSSDSVEKIMTAIELLGTKIDTQTAVLWQEITSIRQELHSTASSLQTANAQHSERLDDLEQSTTAWSSTVFTLETAAKKLQSDVCNLTTKCIVGIEEGQEGTNPRQFCATALKEILNLEETPRLDRGHRSLAPRLREGERPRPFIIRVHHGDVKDRILRLSSQKKQLFYKEKRVHIFPDFTLEIAKKRAAFKEAKQLLRTVKDVRFGLRYPATFRITFDGEEKTFTDPHRAISYIKTTILLHHDQTAMKRAGGRPKRQRQCLTSSLKQRCLGKGHQGV
ncbi:uncharacterized protein [Paramormyrops kingsleyae]|uniref:uncharacterized protein isoform X1 n=1 Tax=Paramormyrops kingsleyae TaxID=1676925 RepID=UPI003B96CE7B